MRRWFPPLTVWMLLPLVGAALWHATSPTDLRTNPGLSGQVSGSVHNRGTSRAELPQPLTYDTARTDALDRPLFSETRRIPRQVPEQAFTAPVPQEEASTEDPSEPPPEPPKGAFLGYMTVDSRAKALIASLDTQAETWMQEGDVFLDWTLTKIKQDTVHFELHGFQHVLKISR